MLKKLSLLPVNVASYCLCGTERTKENGKFKCVMLCEMLKECNLQLIGSRLHLCSIIITITVYMLKEKTPLSIQSIS